MLKDRIKELRKQKGYSQETLAQQLNVVRQTVSKWENGTSVPDAEMLSRLAEIFEVPVSVLLGESFSSENAEAAKPYDEIARQLAILNDQLAAQAANRRKRIRKTLIGILAALLLLAAIYAGAFIMFSTTEQRDQVLHKTTIECTLDGETYRYEVIYDQNFRITEAGGDAFIADHVQTELYDDANVLFAQIEDYFLERGGTYTSTEDPFN